MKLHRTPGFYEFFICLITESNTFQWLDESYDKSEEGRFYVWKSKDRTKCKNNMVRIKQCSGFPTRSHTNRPVQSQKQARNLKFQI